MPPVDGVFDSLDKLERTKPLHHAVTAVESCEVLELTLCRDDIPILEALIDSSRDRVAVGVRNHA